MPSSSQTINVEGQDSSNGFWKQLTQVNQQGADAIQEVTVQTSNYAAEYGQAGGGYINYTMKSGTNQLHGSGFDYLTNTVLNAGLPFTIDPTNPNYNIRNPIHQNDYGFTLGGPIDIPKVYNGHDKTFFFFSFEQFRQTNFTTNAISASSHRSGTRWKFRRGRRPSRFRPWLQYRRIRRSDDMREPDLRSYYPAHRERHTSDESVPGQHNSGQHVRSHGVADSEFVPDAQ